MPSASDAKLQIENGQTVVDFTALSSVGGGVHVHPTAKVWSKFAGNEPEVLPDGLATGGKISAAESGTDDVVTLAALSAFIGGVLVVANAMDKTITRPSTSTHQITSIVIAANGTVSVVSGVEGSAFSETRGAAGAPPFIPVGSIELGQVRLSAQASAAIAASEILSNPGQHTERYDYPVFDVYSVGDKDNTAFIRFSAALEQIHSDDDGTTVAAKGVYAKVSIPVFTDINYAADFKTAEISHSSSSTPVYMGRNVVGSSESLGQGGFTAFLQDGVTDGLVGLANQFLSFRYYPSQYKPAHHIVQGKLGIGRSYPAGDNINAACTITAEQPGVNRAS